MSMTIEQAEAALNAAMKAYDDEMLRDTDRGEGSMRTEPLRLERQESMRKKIAHCEQCLEEAKRQRAGK
ncbi:MAG: hypothetical protein ACRYF8_10500 [Janthinobacterium lividum]